MTSPDHTDSYLAERVRSALATDARVGALGLSVRVVSRRVVISGGVASDSCRDSVGVVAAEIVGELEVVNETVTVVPGPPPAAAEALG